LIARRTIAVLGASQLVCWGISYYLVALFAPFMTAELGWSTAAVHGGFSAALVVMGLTSPLVGRLIDRHGGAPVMTAGSLITALGCAGLALAGHLAVYYAAWLCLGVAMRMTLYDAAFAALVRLGGPAARRPIAQITLLGGLASTVFWPMGHWLAGTFGWRAALLVYAGLALATGFLHRTIPRERYRGSTPAPESSVESLPPSASPAHASASTPPGPHPSAAMAAGLYALIAALTTFMNSGMSAHMFHILGGLGAAAPVAVAIATLRGVGQSGARLAEVLFGGRLHPLVLAVLATSLLPVGFAAGLFSGQSSFFGAAFALLFGAGNGLVTIVRGTAPLVLFDARAYGALVGRLLAPSFFLSASAPLVYALVIDAAGASAALHLSIVIAAVTCAAAALLAARFRRASPPP